MWHRLRAPGFHTEVTRAIAYLDCARIPEKSDGCKGLQKKTRVGKMLKCDTMGPVQLGHQSHEGP